MKKAYVKPVLTEGISLAAISGEHRPAKRIRVLTGNVFDRLFNGFWGCWFSKGKATNRLSLFSWGD
jgi:hypothetical protein